ncbi:MAG: hypothetical protein GX802_07815 [Clostridiales bacterium]|jgi:hypothetical protein|nr:hypothetical protein [Clostridiales bacterium]
MFVRVYDKDNRTYYKSIVYGKINTGYYEQAILFNPSTNSFELIDYLDKDGKKLSPLYEVINSNRDDWVTYEKVYLLKFKHYCKEHGYVDSINVFDGYDEVFQDFDFLLRIITEKRIPKENSNIHIRKPHDINSWTYIESQEDANSLLHDFVGFHDSTMEKMQYEESHSGQKTLTVTFDNSGWYGIVELCFEGLIALNLRPPQENYSREIYGGSLIVNDE